ncbi:MAG: DUF2130 domain-containing protein [Pseudomonadota bacterium]
MSDLKITCPTCATEIELTEQLAGPLVADLKTQFGQQIAAKEAELKDAVAQAAAKAKADGKAEADEEAKALAERLAAQDAKLAELREKNAAATKREQALKDREAELELTIEARLSAERAALAERQAEKDAQQEAKVAEAKAAQAKAEAEALKREQALKDREAALDLTVQKKLAQEREVLERQLAQTAEEKALLKVAEKDQKIDALTKRIEDLQQRATQGSMQTQGEAAEMVLEDTLAQAFPIDGFSPVGKGQQGADVQQDVMAPAQAGGGIAGSILWESKRTKNWSAGWLAKLRDDQRSSGCEIAVLTSVALPDGVETFGMVDGIWVCAPRYVVPLASSLRQGLLDVAAAKSRAIGQETKAELVYEYFTGVQFRQRIEAIVERFEDMQDNLRKERVFMEKQWALRSKQIDLVIASTVGMHGDLQAIAGRSMPEIESVEALMISDGDE